MSSVHMVCLFNMVLSVLHQSMSIRGFSFRIVLSGSCCYFVSTATVAHLHVSVVNEKGYCSEAVSSIQVVFSV